MYKSRCAISGCDAEETLEAAHILPYRGRETNHPSNGLLLRADLHTLFDLGLLVVDTANMRVMIAPSLKGTWYAQYDGVRLRLPESCFGRPSIEALDIHRKAAHADQRDECDVGGRNGKAGKARNRNHAGNMRFAMCP